MVSGQLLGVGDGSTTTFALARSHGTAAEPVAGTSGVAAVYENGVAIPDSLWSVAAGYAPQVVFATAPAAGVVVSADFGALWLCRFAEDIADLENFMTLLWAFRTVKLQTVRP
jgi:hypothetical protein